MAIDGVEIIDSDLAHDIHNELRDLYDYGKPIGVVKSAARSYRRDLVDVLDLEIFLAVYVKFFWEIGELDNGQIDELSALLERGDSLREWEKIVGPEGAREREKILQSLISRARKPHVKPKVRKNYLPTGTKLFKVGDCLELEAEGEVYRSVMTEIVEYRGRCEYFMLVMEPDTESTVSSFRSSKYYASASQITGYSDTAPGPHVIRLEHKMLLKAGLPFRVIGNVEIDPDKYQLGSFGGVLDMEDVIEDFRRTHENGGSHPDVLVPLRELLKPRTFVDWLGSLIKC